MDGDVMDGDEWHRSAPEWRQLLRHLAGFERLAQYPSRPLPEVSDALGPDAAAEGDEISFEA
jgi:hypothetical protein